ncbi:hypothetical protein [Roseibium aggregatum]|uniref:Uncharacterized protein n=1 Tax=Roseibium aggregatum TaxID=187304 RepID=A0A939EH50_9HYPH|nr:hypothetical protein [Roseibium aggregatum]MBN9672636.1 hypothetical protein [Roseibium aggregatum]
MILFLLVPAFLLYTGVASVFLILSSMELLENNMSSPVRLAGAFATSVFWPVTLAGMSLYVLMLPQIRRFKSAEKQSSFRLSHRPH